MKLTKRLIGKENPDYDGIGNYINSKDSVVGIDAKHTHIIIIKKLIELEEKLEKLEKKMKGGKSKTKKKK